MKKRQKLWTEAQLAAHLQVSVQTVVRERKRGKLKYTRIGTKIRLCEEHIQEYLKTQEGVPDPRQKPALSVVRRRC